MWSIFVSSCEIPSFFRRSADYQRKLNRENYCVDVDLRTLFHSILDDHKCGFSLSSFIRQATAVRKTWLGEVCVRVRLCAPPSHWNRNIFSHALADTDVPVDVARDFDSGRPWLFADLVS